MGEGKKKKVKGGEEGGWVDREKGEEWLVELEEKEG